MGNSIYSFNSRQRRTKLYNTQSLLDTFIQQRKNEINEGMHPKNIEFRESRDSETHPNTVPISLFLDVTGSMGRIPHYLIKEGLPKMVSTLINKGIKSPAIMFGAIGDHFTDQAPLQISQFESGDEELDMWLTRTWLEGNGGGNSGESYSLAWYFNAYHVVTDRVEKNRGKNYLFTIGDEPIHEYIDFGMLKSYFGNTLKTEKNIVSSKELLDAAKIHNEVFHIHLKSTYYPLDPLWKKLLGDNLIVCENEKEIPLLIANTINNKENNYFEKSLHEDKSDNNEIIL